MSDSIVCPSCHCEIEVTEALASRLRGELEEQFQSELRRREVEFSRRAAALNDRERQLQTALDDVDRQVAARLDQERQQLVEQTFDRARLALRTDLEDARRETAELRQKLQDSHQAELVLRRTTRELELQQQNFDVILARRIEEERTQAAREALLKARESVELELQDARHQADELQQKLRSAQDVELELRRQARAFEEERRELELTITRRLDDEKAKVRAEALRQAAEERELKEAEHDKQMNDLRRQIDELKRKSEQTSQQLQGEVMELSLEQLLRREFPSDEILPIPKGVHGGDVLQQVRDGYGTACGAILWESKRTKNWNGDWLPKLRDDQRAAKAQLAALASVELPSGLQTFACLDGVWVTSRSCVAGLAAALRYGLIQVATAKRALDGQQDKMTLLYGYLSGPEFRHRVEGIVESFVTLKDDLEKEKRSMQRMWARREKQLERAVFSTSSLYGDLGGIIGSSLPQIEQLELPPLLEGPEDDD